MPDARLRRVLAEKSFGAVGEKESLTSQLKDVFGRTFRGASLRYDRRWEINMVLRTLHLPVGGFLVWNVSAPLVAYCRGIESQSESDCINRFVPKVGLFYTPSITRWSDYYIGTRLTFPDLLKSLDEPTMEVGLRFRARPFPTGLTLLGKSIPHTHFLSSVLLGLRVGIKSVVHRDRIGEQVPIVEFGFGKY
jgi:hypothetical protein